VKKLLCSTVAAFVVATAAHAETLKVMMFADPTNSSQCSKGAGTTGWPITIEANRIIIGTKGEQGDQADVLSVAADGSFDKVVEMLSANTFSFQVRFWGNVKTHELHTHNARRFCKYNGTW
jgi:hypothetical protein